MLNIQKILEGSVLTITLVGRLDVETTDQLTAEIDAIPAEVTELKVDMQELEYVSSAGLRTLLLLAKAMADRGGAFSCINVPKLIQETFEMTKLSKMMGL